MKSCFNRKIISTLLLVLFISWFLVSCAISPGGDKDFYGEYPESGDSRAPADTSNGIVVTGIRHVVRTGSLDLTVTDARETTKKVKDLVEDAGGIISSSYIYEMRDGRQAASLTLRIPSKNFDRFFEQLETLGNADNINTREKEVTREYVDLEARLKNLLAHEEQVREILKMAATVDEVLAVGRELGQIRGEIESMTARFTQLKDQVSYSTIELNIFEEPTLTISAAPFENIGRRLKDSFAGSINFILNAFAILLVVLAALLPVLFVLFLAFLFLRFIIIRAKRKPPQGHA